MKVWLLPFPLSDHFLDDQNDIKSLAVKNRLDIVNDKYRDQFNADDIAEDVPKLKAKVKNKGKGKKTSKP